MDDCMSLNLSLSCWESVARSLSVSQYSLDLLDFDMEYDWCSSLLILFPTAMFLLAMVVFSRQVCWSAKNCMVIHGYSAAHSSCIPVGVEPWHAMSTVSFVVPHIQAFLVPSGTDGEKAVCCSNANDLLSEKHSIQKRYLFMASENENMNIADILAGSPTSENYKDTLNPEGQLCGDCNFEVWCE